MRRQSPDAIDNEVERLVDFLSDHANALAPDDLVSSGRIDLDCAGLYGWWVDEPGAIDLSRGLQQAVAPGLIYVGKSVSLWRRIARQHLGTRHTKSTLRRSLGPVIAAANEFSVIDEPMVTAWMNEHLRVAAVPVLEPELLGLIEARVVVALHPPLNIDHMPGSEYRKPLQGLRSRASWRDVGGATIDDPRRP